MDTLADQKIEKRKPGRPSTNDSRRKEILEKSTDCFIKFGFNKTTLDEIGDAIGFNKAALYYYFKNKEELFLQVVNNQLTIGLNKLQHDIAEVPDSETKILKYFWNRTQVYTNIIKLTSLSSENILDLNNTFEEIYAPYKKAEIKYIKDILITINPSSKSSSEVEIFSELLFDVVNSMSLSALLVKNISNQAAVLETHNQRKETVIKYLLKSFYN
jgi:AcrR family transcriptional regulator